MVVGEAEIPHPIATYGSAAAVNLMLNVELGTAVETAAVKL